MTKEANTTIIAGAVILTILNGMIISLLPNGLSLIVIEILLAGALYLIFAPSIKPLILMTIAAPWYQYRFDIPIFPIHLTAHRLLLAITLANLLVHAVSYKSEQHDVATMPLERKRLRLVLLFLTFWCGLEIVASLRSDYSEGFNRLFPRVVGILTMASVIVIVKSPSQLRSVVYGYMASALAPLVFGLWQLVMWLRTGIFPGLLFQGFLEQNLEVFDQAYKGAQAYNIGAAILPRFASSMVDPNYLAIFLATTALITFSTLFRPSLGLKRAVIVVFFILSVAMMLLTLSRSALIGFGIGLLILLVLKQWQQRSAGDSVWYLFLIVLLSALGYLILSELFQTEFTSIVALRFEPTVWSKGVENRAMFVAAAMEAFAHNPVFGVGAHNISSYSEFYTGHSTPVTVLAEYGITGFLLLYAFIAWLVKGIWSLALHDTEDLAPGILAGFLCLLAGSLFYSYWFTLESNWILWGLGVAATLTLADTSVAYRTRAPQTLVAAKSLPPLD